MKVFIAGDLVGSTGRRLFKIVASEMLKERKAHAIVVNGENAAGGNGITLALAKELFDAGADTITLGDHAWGQKELEALIDKEKRLLRPLNMPPGTPGNGVNVVQTTIGSFAIINLLGRVFMQPTDCPFRAIDALLPTLPATMPIIIDFHAEATSEMIAMGHFLDGRVTAVVGTHTHVQTNDAQILPKGTAFISDIGMCGPGPSCSVIGREIAPVLKRFTTGLPAKFEISKGAGVVEGVIIECNHSCRKAVSIEPFRYHETKNCHTRTV